MKPGRISGTSDSLLPPFFYCWFLSEGIEPSSFVGSIFYIFSVGIPGYYLFKPFPQGSLAYGVRSSYHGRSRLLDDFVGNLDGNGPRDPKAPFMRWTTGYGPSW